MNEKTVSTVFALSRKDKEEALEAIAHGIQQLTWQTDYVRMQVEALPAVPEDAPAEVKQERAKRNVQIDAMDKKIEDQIAFYNFCKSQI